LIDTAVIVFTFEQYSSGKGVLSLNGRARCTKKHLDNRQYLSFSRLIAEHPQNGTRQGRAQRVHFSLDGVCFADIFCGGK